MALSVAGLLGAARAELSSAQTHCVTTPKEQRGKGSSRENLRLLLEVMEAEMPPAPPDPAGLRYFTSVEDLILCSKCVFKLNENSVAKCLPV